MTQPDFTFDEKTGELERDETALVLGDRQRRVFAAIGSDFISTKRLAFKAKIPYADVGLAVMGLRARLKRFGILIESKRGLGYRLVVGAMPTKWQPDIPPPVTIENLPLRSKRAFATPNKPWTADEIERGVALRIDHEMDWDEIAAALGRKSITTVHDQISRAIRRRDRAAGLEVKVGKLTPDQIETRDRRRMGYDARDLTSVLCGDPPKGFSALDRKARA